VGRCLTCASDYGTLTSQNYIDLNGVRHTIYSSSSYTGHVEGQIQGSLSNLYGANRISTVLGAATEPESGNVQEFEGGYLQRNNRTGVRVEGYVCGVPGCLLFAVLRYSAYGVFCPSVNADRIVNSIDLGLIAGANNTANLNYDLNVSGVVNSIDLGLAAARFSNTPCGVDFD
jgi:hypothetical protein